jgi:hypothetical protein
MVLLMVVVMVFQSADSMVLLMVAMSAA